MDINKVFNSFCKKLEERKGFLSEDNVRFYWFASMLEQDAELNHYSLEEPYPHSLKGKELDLMYESGDDMLCFEIKFHRHPKREDGEQHAFPHTMSAGEVFNDILRLPMWERAGKRIRHLFLYVTDEEMHKYLRKESKGDSYRQQLNDFYPDGKYFLRCTPIEILFTEMPQTFKKSATSELEEQLIYEKIRLALLDQADFPCDSPSIQANGNCHVRLYEI